jgi:hypothetical protein
VKAQGHELGPTCVYEDNEGVIKIMNDGRSPKHRTKHLNIRHFFARDRIKTCDIVIQYKPTGEMIADMMTKPLSGKQFVKLSQELTGNVLREGKVGEKSGEKCSRPGEQGHQSVGEGVRKRYFIAPHNKMQKDDDAERERRREKVACTS